jgi:hypothetical protein
MRVRKGKDMIKGRRKPAFWCTRQKLSALNMTAGLRPAVAVRS